MTAPRVALFPSIHVAQQERATGMQRRCNSRELAAASLPTNLPFRTYMVLFSRYTEMKTES